MCSESLDTPYKERQMINLRRLHYHAYSDSLADNICAKFRAVNIDFDKNFVNCYENKRHRLQTKTVWQFEEATFKSHLLTTLAETNRIN